MNDTNKKFRRLSEDRNLPMGEIISELKVVYDGRFSIKEQIKAFESLRDLPPPEEWTGTVDEWKRKCDLIIENITDLQYDLKQHTKMIVNEILDNKQT